MMGLQRIDRCPECGSSDLHGPTFNWLAQGCFTCGHIHPLIKPQDSSRSYKKRRKVRSG